MAVVTIGNSSYPIRIGDNATPGSGTYEVYLNGEYVPAQRQAVPDMEYEANELNDSYLLGKFRYAFTVKNCDFKNYVVSVLSDWEKFMIAWRAWAEAGAGGSVLYYTEKNKAAYNIRQWPKDDYSGMETLTVKLLSVIELPPQGENKEYYQRFDAVFKKVNPATIVS